MIKHKIDLSLILTTFEVCNKGRGPQWNLFICSTNFQPHLEMKKLKNIQRSYFKL